MKNYAILAAALLVISLSSAAPALANGGDEKPATELKFLGSEKNQVLFQLKLNNTLEDEYTITITDVYGNILYSNEVKGANITKKFSLNMEEIGVDKLLFKVRSRKSNQADIFEVNRNVRFVEEANVSKIK